MTRYGFMAPRGSLDKKPAHGSPCNRCGLCCQAVLCPLGQHLFKREEGPCPALEKLPDGTYGCGVVSHPARWGGISRVINHGKQALSAAALLMIGSGQGCDARFNGEPGDEAFYRRMREYDRKTRGEMNRAKRLWGIT